MTQEIAADAAGDLPGTLTAGLHVAILQDYESILSARDSIEKLCEDLCETNVFFEPWFLLPALRYLGTAERIHFLCLYETTGRQRLCGFFPLVESRLHPLIPLKIYQAWAHRQCFRCTPLVRKGFAEAFWCSLLSWLASRPWHCRLLDLQRLPAEGELWNALEAALRQRTSFRTLLHRHHTAFLHADTSYEEVLKRAMSGATKRKLHQSQRRLAEAGRVSFVEVGGGAGEGHSIEALTEAFLELESSGWKGKAGTALASNEQEADFFRQVIRVAADREELCLLALCLDGQMIAAHCIFLHPPGSFHFKTAYNEAFRRYSPGTLLQMEETRRLCDPKDPLRASVLWSDSCAGPNDGPDYRCWPDRMAVARCRITTSWTLHAIPLMLWPLIRRVLRFSHRADKAQPAR